MTVSEPTTQELSRRGREALCKELGVAGAIRFMQLGKAGTGDYTKERQSLFAGKSLDELVTEIKNNRK